MNKCHACRKYEMDTPGRRACCLSHPLDVKPCGIAIVGNPDVGKSSLFYELGGKKAHETRLWGLPSPVSRSRNPETENVIYDTPGITSIFSTNEEERAAKDLLLPGSMHGSAGRIILSADAKNLKRSLAMALQYSEYGIPMLLNINMADEAEACGISIDTEKLSETLGIDVCKTVARNGSGTDRILSHIPEMKIPKILVTYPDPVEQYLEITGSILGDSPVSSRMIGLLLLSDDPGIKIWLREKYGCKTLKRLLGLAAEHNDRLAPDFTLQLATLYNRKADEIAGSVQQNQSGNREPLSSKIGLWCMKPVTGVPIALVILFLMYQFVGSFGATFLVDTINTSIFEGYLIPKVTGIVSHIPYPFIRDMIVDPDFGILPTGVFLAIGLVLPVLLCFYIAFGMLEDSGYLTRLSILMDRVFQKMGLNGKGVIPLVMGFSCVTMALLTTRLLNTKKEKNIASFLLLLGMPCAPLLAVMLVILDKMPVSASITVFGVIFMQILIAGFLADKILSGVRSPLIMELQPIRVPKFSRVLNLAGQKTWHFMKEALPVFIFASLVVFLFERAGGLLVLEKMASPLVSGFMGLPEKSVQVFIKTIIRRESGATEIQHLSTIYDNVQLVVNLLVMTFLSPCINATIVLIKERGVKTAISIIAAVMVYAVVVGSTVNHVCRALGVTF